jgi:hypothetical protein
LGVSAIPGGRAKLVEYLKTLIIAARPDRSPFSGDQIIYAPCPTITDIIDYYFEKTQ